MDHTILESFLAKGEDLQVLFRQLNEKNAVHAYLLTGESGTGKKNLAKLISAALLCSSAREKPCCECKSCRLALESQHPDQIIIEQGKPLAQGIKRDRATIPVEDIREMIRLCSVRSTEGNMHAVLLFDADRMTVQAQNCLLKTLEEPPADTSMILVTDHPETLLSTVISRCRTIRLKAWDDRYIIHVLEKRGIKKEHAQEIVSASNGSVGRALQLADDNRYWELRDEVLNCFFKITSRSDVIRISNAWKDRKQDSGQILDILGHFLALLAESRFHPGKKTDLSCFPSQWQRFAANAKMEAFTSLIDAVSLAREHLQFSVNFQAVLEKLLFTFIGEGNSWL